MISSAALTYFFFSRMAHERHIRWFLKGAVIMGIISAVFFVVDTGYKRILNQATQYSYWAHLYSIHSEDIILGDFEANTFRIDSAYRSFGLLERHSTSALWVIMGFFSYCTLEQRLSSRRNAFSLTLLCLLFTQNFTALFTFLVISLHFNRKFFSFKSILYPLIAVMAATVIFDAEMVRSILAFIWRIIQSQISMVLTIDTVLNPNSFSSLVIHEFNRFISEAMTRPHQLLIGFGLSANPYYGTSGDVGFFESIMRIGLPLWSIFTWQVVLAFLNLRRSVNKNRNLAHRKSIEIKQLGICIISAIWLMDLHYSCWIYKTIFPIFFFAIALARRNPDPVPRSRAISSNMPSQPNPVI
ncbi:MAG: hypothetical protein COR54_19540 [Elusimicrobia bacterium CG22_combo_CG10-13_8_21_14_all_63_91]|nr:MAG: hypothetical protein COR54_19540 [Elusimicrobia bacterium CG22_combo_CG10-13_8_21_14_all_63_91]